MKCPVCNDVNLLISNRQGVEIDYCPQCRGVWLDRGELDKIIERSAEYESAPSRPEPSYREERREERREAPRDERREAPRHDDRYQDDRHSGKHGHGDRYQDDRHSAKHTHDQHEGGYKKKKRESFFSDLFDFDI